MAEKAEGESKGKKINVMAILAVVGVVANFGVVGAGLYFAYAATLGWNAPAITEEELVANLEKANLADSAELEKGPMILTMEQFTVNLTGEPKRTVRLEVNLSMLNRAGFEELLDSAKTSKVRDRVVAMLQDRSFQDLESIQGKLFLKDQIVSETNRILKDGVVQDVFFSQFVVQ